MDLRLKPGGGLTAGSHREIGGPPRARRLWWVLLLALVTVVLGVAVPVAPVQVEDPTVSWPRAGEEAMSTDLPLAPYRPLSIDATVPCSALRPDVVAVRTLPTGSDQGLTVASFGGRVGIRVSGRLVLDEPIPPGDCGYRITADGDGVRVERGGTTLAAERALPPQVAQLVTDAADRRGLRVELRPDDRYASSPTVLKTALLIAHFVALLATFVVAWRTWRGAGSRWRLPRPGPADAVLVAVSVGWAVIGPMSYDDGWYALMARGAGRSGYVGNYVNIFNVTEAPFATSQYLMYLWGSIGGWSLLWLRLLPVLYGITTWVLLRILLQVALGRAAGLPRVQWALLVAHLVWWLPYGLTLRPEPLLAMCAAAVLLLTDLARRRHSIGLLALAAAAAVLATAATPSGIVAAAPLVLALPWLGRWLAEADRLERVTVVAIALATVTVAVPVGFADTSLGQAADANAVRQWYFFTFPWYEENVHWNVLLSGESWGRRVPVLLAVAVLLMVAVGSGRSPRRRDPLHRLMFTAAITTAVGFVLLLPTPTKGVNHFGTLAASGTVLLATALLRSPVPQRLGRAAPSLPAVVAALLAVLASALAFSGPNLWLPYTDWGHPFGNHVDGDKAQSRPHIGPLYLNNPVGWAVGAAAVAMALAWWRRHRRSTMTVDRAVLLSASGGATLLMLLVFVIAPVRQSPGLSVAEVNLATLTGDSCGLARGVKVLAPTGLALDTPVGDEIRSGGFGPSSWPPPLAPPAPGPVWHDAGPGAPEVGELTTPWWPLPALTEHLAVPVSAGDYQNQEVVAEFAGDGLPEPRAQYRLPLETMRPDTWQDVPVDVAAGSTAIRLVVRDRRTGPGTWLAVAPPRPAEWVPVSDVIGGRPAFADQLSAPLWPCVDQIGLRHGIVETPEVYLAADSDIGELVLRNPYFDYGGGNLANVERTTTYLRLASRLDPAPGVPIRPWGQVRLAIPDHPVGLVDLTVTESRRNGWERGPTLATEAYSGRRDTG